MDYAARFKKLEEKVNALDHVTYKMIFSNPPVTDSTLSRFVKYLKFPIPDDLIAFYQSINGFMLIWRYLDEDVPMHVQGCSTISSMDDMLAYKAKPKKYGLAHLTDLLEDHYWVFDSLQNGHFILVKIQPDTYSFHLCLPNTEILRLNLTLPEYFNILFDCGGVFCWQAYTVEQPENIISRFSYDMFIEHVVRLFPDADLTDKSRLKVEVATKRAYPFFQRPNLFQLIEASFDPQKYHIDLLRLEKEPGVSFAAVRKVETQINQKLPEEFVAFFYLMNGLSVYWKYSRTNKDVVGNFRILPLEIIFGGTKWYDKQVWNNNVFKYFNLDKSYDKSLKDYYPLYIDDTGYIIFNLEKNQVNLKLWSEMPLLNIRLSFKDFIVAMFNCRGIEYWQYFATDATEYDVKNIPFNVPEQLIDIFGDVDISNLRSYTD
jgi:hypothetical protein